MKSGKPTLFSGSLSRSDIYRLVAVPLVALACNEALGLDPGKPGPVEGGGTSGSNAEGGSALSSGTGGATNGGSGAASGEGGAPDGGVAGTGGGQGGTPGGGGSKAGNGGSGNAGDSGSAGAGGVGCSSVECREQGGDLCLNGTCADITTDGCSILIGEDWIDDDPEAEPVVFGAYGRFDPASIEESTSYWNLELAMKELTEYGPIPIDGAPRRPVLLLCHAPPEDERDTLQMFELLNHLVDGVGVSGILMIASRFELYEAADYTLNAAQKDVFFLDPFGPNGALLNLPDGVGLNPGRLWHMRGDNSAISYAFKPLIERVEEHVNPGASTRQAARPTRLVLVTTTYNDEFEYYTAALLDTYSLRINGEPTSRQPENYRNVVSVGQPLSTLAQAVAELEPDIVINFGGTSALLPLIDAAMNGRGAPPPFYVLPPSFAASSQLVQVVTENLSLRTRIVGVNYAGSEDTTLYDAYLERLQRLAPNTLDVRWTQNLYDSVYSLIYSAVAGGRGGFNMGAGMVRLMQASPRRDIGPDSIGSVIDGLADADAMISFYGTLGRSDFNSSGARAALSTVWCLTEDVDYAMDVLRMDPQQVELTGTFPCFDF